MLEFLIYADLAFALLDLFLLFIYLLNLGAKEMYEIGVIHQILKGGKTNFKKEVITPSHRCPWPHWGETVQRRDTRMPETAKRTRR